ncbi:MAG: hypothetical protein DRP56_05280 [Planctomycetota bacterium]|nr:MAG: hypothetical protein DRP56_05280 [Planctomycetota bacterium]
MDVKTGHKAAQSTCQINNLNGVSIPPKTGSNSSKTAFLTSNNRPAIIPGNQGPVAQLVRAADGDSTQREKSKELTNISPSVTPIITAPPPELPEIINCWDVLPEHIKETIKMLVDTAGEKSD